MGKANKKSAAKTGVAPAAVVPASKPGMKGKRGTDNVIEKIANAKKQKMEVKTQIKKKQEEPSDSEEEEPSDSEQDQEDDGSSDEEVVAADDSAKLKNGSADPAVEGDSDESGDNSEGDEDESGESDGEEGDEEDSDAEMEDPAPKKNTKKAVATEKKEPKTPSTQATGSKTLFVANLPFNIEEDDVMEFFKDAGEVVAVRFALRDDGKPKGFCHVEFASAEAATNALKLNETSLMGRPVRLDLANERGAYTPNTGKEGNKGGRSESQTVFVRGFDSSLGEDEIRSSLLEHFSSCGELAGTAIRIPVDRDTQSSKGIAYVQFGDANSFKKALKMDGTELGDGTLKVEEAKPRGDSGGGGGGFRGSSGGRGRGGRGGRDGGGRGRGRGGRDGGRGRGGGGGGRFGSRGRGRRN